ncbi:hypothetical protein CBW56_08890 [Denitratisoma oestradiolicum]|nr:hypothetical protein CBW56_08890 [Denitratisoma oestradiolicum]
MEERCAGEDVGDTSRARRKRFLEDFDPRGSAPEAGPAVCRSGQWIEQDKISTDGGLPSAVVMVVGTLVVPAIGIACSTHLHPMEN